MTSESHLLLGEDEVLKKPNFNKPIRRCCTVVLTITVFVITWNYVSKEGTYTQIVRRNIAKILQQDDVINYQPRNGPIRPFYNTYSFYPILKNYNLAACYTPKVMATTLSAIFCYLSDTEEFKKKNLSMTTVYWNTQFCKEHRPQLNNTATIRDGIEGKLHKFVIYRHPIARFVRAFVNKCVNELEKKKKFNETIEICFGCNDDLECVVQKSYEVAISLSRGERFFNQLKWAHSYAFVHFSPESWDCDISRQYKGFTFVRYGSSGLTKKRMSNDIMKVFEDSGVEGWKMEEIGAVVHENKPLTHATRGSELPKKLMEKIYNSPLILDTLTKLYYYDFQMFDFAIPKLGELPPHDL